jgi:hypothetical protein
VSRFRLKRNLLKDGFSSPLRETLIERERVAFSWRIPVRTAGKQLAGTITVSDSAGTQRFAATWSARHAESERPLRLSATGGTIVDGRSA